MVHSDAHTAKIKRRYLVQQCPISILSTVMPTNSNVMQPVLHDILHGYLQMVQKSREFKNWLHYDKKHHAYWVHEVNLI